jgi:tetratricopeptide (TPR) repeat protein
MKHRPKKSKPSRRLATPLSSGRKWLFRVIAMIVLPALLLGGLEIILRLAGYGYSTGFFEKIRVGNREFFVNKDNFSRRFFPPQLQRWPSPVMFAAEKPANTYRIFILGESAARGEPEPPFAASRYLQVLLNERFPGAHFEVINLGVTAIDSHVILPIARDCAKAGGDLWIIYMGNNEMVGPFGAATVFGAKAPPLGFVRLNLAMQQTRLGQLLVDLSRRLRTEKTPAAWSGMDMFVGNQLRADDPRKEVVYENFARNLNDIIRVGLKSGAKILLNTVAVNLKDCPPFASLINSNLPAAERAQFEKLFSTACTNEAEGRLAAATEQFSQAAKLDPLFPELQYRWGKCLLALTNFTEARAHLQAACDDDALPFRADSRINDAIEKAGQKYAGGQLTFVNAAAALAAPVSGSICGEETFFEHVHFTFDGNFQLGLVWAEQAAKMLPPEILQTAITNGWASQELCERRLGLTDWHRRSAIEIAIDRLRQPPLSTQLDNAERIQKLDAEAEALRQRMNPAAAQQALGIYQSAIEHSPQDYWLVENYAEFLELAGDLKGAAAAWQHECELLPHDANSFYQYGRLLSARHQWAEAETALAKALSLRPRLTGAWFELGGVHLAEQKYESALQDYNQARRLEPQEAAYAACVAKVLSQLERHAEAMELYREAIKMQPDLWTAHFGLGDELAVAGRFSEAENEYAQVIRSQPDLALAHLNRGMMLVRLGKSGEAAQEFQETLRLEPGNRTALEYLKQIAASKDQRQ